METTTRLYPTGIQDFEMIRQHGYVYVDKTRYVHSLASRVGKALFLSRPRRYTLGIPNGEVYRGLYGTLMPRDPDRRTLREWNVQR